MTKLDLKSSGNFVIFPFQPNILARLLYFHVQCFLNAVFTFIEDCEESSFGSVA
jgi:hypothetical protein